MIGRLYFNQSLHEFSKFERALTLKNAYEITLVKELGPLKIQPQ